MALNYMFCMGATYVLGTLIYSTRVPECFFPGKFDNFVSWLRLVYIEMLLLDYHNGQKLTRPLPIFFFCFC